MLLVNKFLIISFCVIDVLTIRLLVDPYSILKVNKYATAQDIRRAYKQLAKEWHPDKSSHLDAEEKFIQVKQAYELLIDPERRKVYDQYGVTDEESRFLKKKHDYSSYDRFASDPIEEFFGKHFFFDEDISIYHKLSVTTKYFEYTILPKSTTIPHILMFYNDWCFRCTRLVNAFKKLIDTLEPIGIQFAALNVAHEQALARKTGVYEIPKLILILNGNSYIYHDSSYQPNKVVEFIRKKIPDSIFQKINDNNVDEFLRGWSDNKVRALVMEPRNQTRLRYLISAFTFQKRVAFGFVDLTKTDSKLIQSRLKVHPKLDSLFIFNEDSDRSAASVSMSDIPTLTLKNIILSNQYLTLPRLSSQDMLEGVCPAEWNRPRKRLCVVLITENSNSHDFARGALRSIAIHSGYNSNKVRFAYMFKEKQIDFINAISKGSKEKNLPRIVILWRRDISHVKYEWIDNTYLNLNSGSPQHKTTEHLVNYTKVEIDSSIQRLLSASEALSYEAFVQNLLDEHAQGIISKFFSRLLYVMDYFSDNIEEEHILAILSLFGTIFFMLAVGYVMMYFVRAEEESLKIKGKINTENCQRQGQYVPELKFYELRAEKYNGMVRLLKPGCRTVILITDLQSRSKLIPLFHKAVWPYRKTKTLIFGHLLIEKGLSWYSDLLRLSLCELKNLQINPRNCVGTVLSLNGHRKYFCMYHAKHPESVRGAKRIIRMTKQLLKITDDPEVGEFLNVDLTDDSDAEPKILLEENLLDGLNNWLDRLFEGTTHRYYINYWPDFPTK